MFAVPSPSENEGPDNGFESAVEELKQLFPEKDESVIRDYLTHGQIERKLFDQVAESLGTRPALTHGEMTRAAELFAESVRNHVLAMLISRSKPDRFYGFPKIEVKAVVGDQTLVKFGEGVSYEQEKSDLYPAQKVLRVEIDIPEVIYRLERILDDPGKSYEINALNDSDPRKVKMGVLILVCAESLFQDVAEDRPPSAPLFRLEGENDFTDIRSFVSRALNVDGIAESFEEWLFAFADDPDIVGDANGRLDKSFHGVLSRYLPIILEQYPSLPEASLSENSLDQASRIERELYGDYKTLLRSNWGTELLNDEGLQKRIALAFVYDTYPALLGIDPALALAESKGLIDRRLDNSRDRIRRMEPVPEDDKRAQFYYNNAKKGLAQAEYVKQVLQDRGDYVLRVLSS